MEFCITLYGTCFLRPKKTSDFLRDAVETRLRMYIPYIETWPQVSCAWVTILVGTKTEDASMLFHFVSVSQAMSLLLLPNNIPDSLKHLSTLVDDIWYYAGDRSTDVSGSYHSRSLTSSSAHTFLSLFHHHPHNIRPATSQVTPPVAQLHLAMCL